jgi:hypothetical protein
VHFFHNVLRVIKCGAPAGPDPAGALRRAASCWRARWSTTTLRATRWGHVGVCVCVFGGVGMCHWTHFGDCRKQGVGDWRLCDAL